MHFCAWAQETDTLYVTGTQRLLRPQARLQCFIKDKDRSHVLGSKVGDNPDTDQKSDVTLASEPHTGTSAGGYELKLVFQG